MAHHVGVRVIAAHLHYTILPFSVFDDSASNVRRIGIDDSGEMPVHSLRRRCVCFYLTGIDIHIFVVKSFYAAGDGRLHIGASGLLRRVSEILSGKWEFVCEIEANGLFINCENSHAEHILLVARHASCSNLHVRQFKLAR